MRTRVQIFSVGDVAKALRFPFERTIIIESKINLCMKILRLRARTFLSISQEPLWVRFSSSRSPKAMSRLCFEVVVEHVI